MTPPATKCCLEIESWPAPGAESRCRPSSCDRGNKSNSFPSSQNLFSICRARCKVVCLGRYCDRPSGDVCRRTTPRSFIEVFTVGRRLHLSRSLKPKTSGLGQLVSRRASAAHDKRKSRLNVGVGWHHKCSRKHQFQSRM